MLQILRSWILNGIRAQVSANRVDIASIIAAREQRRLYYDEKLATLERNLDDEIDELYTSLNFRFEQLKQTQQRILLAVILTFIVLITHDMLDMSTILSLLP